MPPVNRQRSRAAASPPLRASARSNATSSDATAPTTDEETREKPQCSVCFDDLASKRSVKLKQCKHSFHRTCCVSWIETRENRDTQACPLCRKRVYDILDENNRPIEQLIAFGGSGQPTKQRVFRAAADLKEPRIDSTIKWLIEKNQKDLGTVRAQKELAQSESKSDEYVADIDTELEKLTKRDQIYEEMMQVWRSGGMVDADDDDFDDSDSEDGGWDMEEEMAVDVPARRDARNMEMAAVRDLMMGELLDDDDDEDDDDFGDFDDLEDMFVPEEGEDDLPRDLAHEIESLFRTLSRGGRAMLPFRSMRDTSPQYRLWPPPASRTRTPRPTGQAAAARARAGHAATTAAAANARAARAAAAATTRAANARAERAEAAADAAAASARTAAAASSRAARAAARAAPSGSAAPAQSSRRQGRTAAASSTGAARAAAAAGPSRSAAPAAAAASSQSSRSNRMRH